MRRFKSFKSTLIASFGGYVVQGIVNTFVPLLFITFQNEYGIPLSKITALITINFLLQLCVDLASAFFIDKIGYRACAFLANVFAAVGLALLTVLPRVLPDPFVGLLLSVLFYAIGGGLLEVVVSPIVEACPSKHKAKTMSLLHSFYCWGSVGVISLSALFFAVAGTQHWRVLTLVWAILPAANAVLFLFVPLASLSEDGAPSMRISELLKSKPFWLFFFIILGAGAAESAVAQWASAFAEKGLGVSKTLGDLFGPALFGVAMGVSRLLYGKFGEKIDLKKAMTASGILCVISYLIIAFSPSAVLSLFGMALCGFSVGLMWPGTYSLAAAGIKNGGNAMFSFLALGGDIGCTSGPSVAGYVSGLFGDDLKIGFLFAAIFPLMLTLLLIFSGRKKKSASEKTEERQN